MGTVSTLRSSINAASINPPKKYFKMKFNYTMNDEEKNDETDWLKCSDYKTSHTNINLVRFFDKIPTGDITVTVLMNDQSDGSGSTTLTNTQTFSAEHTTPIYINTEDWA